MMNYMKVKKPMQCDNDRPCWYFLTDPDTHSSYFEWLPGSAWGRPGAWVRRRDREDESRVEFAIRKCQDPDAARWHLVANGPAVTRELDNSNHYPELLVHEGTVLVGRPGRTKEVLVRTTTFPLRSGYYTSAMTVIEELADGNWKKVGQIYDRDANHPTAPINNWQTLRCNVKTPFAGAREYILEATKNVLQKKHKNIDLVPLDSGFAQV